MHAEATVLTAFSVPEIVSALGPTNLALGALVLIAIVVVMAAAWARSRRRLRQDVRSIVQALEELRSGRGRGHTELEARSRIALVADAVRRLGVELHSTWSEAETAAERWRAVTDATRDTAIITTDTDGDIRSFSAGASQLTGWDEDEVVSRPAAVLFDEHAYKDLLPKLARRSLRTQGVMTRSTMMRRDGSSFEAEVSVRMLMGSSSRPVGFMMLVRDITEQIRLENELRDSERRYRGLVESLTEGVIILKEGRIVYVNAAAESLCGRKAPELLGGAWRDRVSTGDVLVVEAALDALAAGTSGGEELRCTILGPEGEARADVRIKAATVEFAGGAAVMLLAQDETAERLVEAELKRNEMRLDAVLETTSDGVLVLADDPGRTVQMTNRSFAEMFGLRVEDLLGASEDRLARLLHESEIDGGALAERLTREPPDERPGVVTVGTVSPREIRVTVARLRGRTGEGLGRVVACRDITERRRSERDLQEQAERLQLSKVELEQSYRKLHEVNRKLASRGEELDRLNQELQRLDKMKSDLIGNVSHELQTPLVSIRGYTEMILKERLGPISEEQRKGLGLTLKNIDRLISMIDSLLAFSRLDPELRDLRLSRFELRPLIDEAIALLEKTIGEKRLEVVVRSEAEGIPIRADRDKILQVFLNLLSNAVKFSHEGGRIEVASGVGPSGYASASVRDDGVGIPQEALGRIFERHFQVRPAPGGAPEGSGIGLAIVRDILRLHGCTVQVSSEVGRGARFTFTLPLAEDETGEPARRDEHDPEPVPDATVSGPERTPGGPPPEPRLPDVPADGPPPDQPGAPPRSTRPRLRIIRRYKSDG
jgi:PAS domain S-box-containing protein